MSMSISGCALSRSASFQSDAWLRQAVAVDYTIRYCQPFKLKHSSFNVGTAFIKEAVWWGTDTYGASTTAVSTLIAPVNTEKSPRLSCPGSGS